MVIDVQGLKVWCYAVHIDTPFGRWTHGCKHITPFGVGDISLEGSDAKEGRSVLEYGETNHTLCLNASKFGIARAN